jgi:hypothetical protein
MQKDFVDYFHRIFTHFFPRGSEKKHELYLGFRINNYTSESPGYKAKLNDNLDLHRCKLCMWTLHIHRTFSTGDKRTPLLHFMFEFLCIVSQYYIRNQQDATTLPKLHLVGSLYTIDLLYTWLNNLIGRISLFRTKQEYKWELLMLRILFNW